jgi:hypothetical protein
MKAFIISVFIVSLLVVTGCSTTQKAGEAKAATAKVGGTKPGPETVLVVYHVQLGRERELQTLLARAWAAHRSQNMVLARPHIIVRQVEEGGQLRFVEIFTWVKPPIDPPASVRAMWQEEQTLCEARNGHAGIEGGPAELVTGK